MKENPTVTDNPSNQTLESRADALRRLDAEHRTLMSLFFYARGHLDRSDDPLIREFAAVHAADFKARADKVKEVIDAY